MPISTGTRLGPYEVVSAVGAGGMGEVYRARDTRLERTVALKVLASQVIATTALKERFAREARAISSLNHPHICHLYDVGCENGTDYLVMELLDGETLSERLRKGPLPLEPALKTAIEIAEALEEAHKQGIIHRDLKPGNIMLTPSGAKLMDFGLSKPANLGAAAGSGSAPLLSAAMTATGPSPSPLTSAGSVVGTIQYMSPEQIEGKAASERSDIFAFGAVLYEMVTGKRAFEGKSQISVAAAILEKDPAPVSALQSASPPALDHVVRTCLAKNPEDRFQTAHDVKLQLRWIAESASDVQSPALVKKQRNWLAWATAGLLLFISLVLGVNHWRLATAPRPVWKSYLPTPTGQSIAIAGRPSGNMAVAPDGRKVVMALTAVGGQVQLWIQPLDALSAHPLSGTEDASYPFWSPDSRSIGFFAGGKLKRIEAIGGPTQAICDAADGRGGSWNSEGVIIFSPSPADRLYVVPSIGGAPAPVTELDKQRHESSHRWPWFLPDGEHFLFTDRPVGLQATAIYLGSLHSKDRRLLLSGNSNAIYVPEGYVLFVREGTLMAQHFDAGRLRTLGDPFPLAESVDYDSTFSKAFFSGSNTGVLIYGQGNVRGNSQLARYDRDGKKSADLTPIGSYSAPSFSPDGKTLAFLTADPGNLDIWLLDLARNVRTRFTFDPSLDVLPQWSPDGKQIAFASTRGGPFDIYVRPADGSQPEQPLLEKTEGDRVPMAWSRDGRYLLFRYVPMGLPEQWAVPMTGEKKPFPVIHSAFRQRWADFSPDGKWIAYESDESGRNQVYVAPFPGPGGRWQVSSEGGEQPLWRGNEIFFLAGEKINSAPVRTRANSVEIGTARTLFSAAVSSSLGRRYDVSRDGKHFVINVQQQATNSVPLTLVVNWDAELKK